ncbi:MAG: hypothetical protein FJ171_11045 [Gammaproteobacteria bacterium]|nr:hypothetical protein [Gammaproteobacteria bacterium]
MKSAEQTREPLQPLAAGGGCTVKPACSRDPYEVLDDLMAVIEALCPEWPPRRVFDPRGSWLL